MLKESEIKRAAAGESCDAQAEQAVRQHLASSGHCGLRNLQVRVDREIVLLAGQVSTYFLKQTAQEVARVVCPDHQIKNLIVVREPEAGTFPCT
ncbi:MAG: BON domain-containing protein [Rubripirellula sp.]